MPYGSNDGYGRQQLRDRPSTSLTSLTIGRKNTAGSHMKSLLSQYPDEVASVWGSSRHEANPLASSFLTDASSGQMRIEAVCFDAPLEPGTGRVRHTPVQVPQGASRQALLSALEQANATIRQLNHEAQPHQASGVARQVLERCEQLEAEQRELVRAVDALGRENASLRQQLRQQAAEASQLREALQRRERDWQQRERERAEADNVSRLSRTLSKPFARLSSFSSGPMPQKQLAKEAAL